MKRQSGGGVNHKPQQHWSHYVHAFRPNVNNVRVNHKVRRIPVINIFDVAYYADFEASAKDLGLRLDNSINKCVV
jgi:hypothetical protein